MESPIPVGFMLPYSPEVPTINNIYAMMWFSKVLKQYFSKNLGLFGQEPIEKI
jgi:hypothetical protein